MILKASGALVCVVTLLAAPALADGSGRTPDEKVPHPAKPCKLLPPSAQPKQAPRAARRDDPADGTLVVTIPRTTCNAGR
ncbi:MAG: hypothetical protein J7518_02095 [Nocardioidaceae bacterium]|nr:hypothetical protein [Nocardioidaceae bacterium]